MLGWIGSILFAVCGLPQAIKAIKDGHANGLSHGFLLLWTGGEIFTLLAIFIENPITYLMFNYVTNLMFLIIMWYYKLRPRK